MQTQRVRVRVRFWFIALYVLLLAFNNCDSHQHQNKHNHKHRYNHNHNKARSKYTTQQSFDDKPEGKIFGWKKQPQTNVFFITRPPTLPTSPLLATATTTVITSPVPAVTAATASATPATVTTVRRPYVQRYGGGGYRRVPVRRQNVRQGQGYRTQRPWNRRRVWAYGREDEAENGSPSNADEEVDHDEDERDVKVGVGLKEGVSAKLDIEQLGKALLSQQGTHIDNDAGQIAVMADDLNKVYKQRLKVKSKRPQSTAILATTLPTTFMPAATATDDATSVDEPTYGNIVVHSNGKTKNTKKKSDKEGDKRPTIWQGIRQAWRERRERQKNAALKKKEEAEQEEEKPQVEIEDEVAYVDGENEIFIDENGEIYIRRRRRHKNNNRNRQQNTRQQQLNIKNKQKKKRKQQEVEEEEEVEVTNNKNSVISENNTNSRFQNIMNAFRRTPIIYKQQSR